jgi:multicomponent Na+:H+ antiporter subunit G
MELAVDLISALCLAAGSVFSVIGAIGILRLPDVFSRMHGAGIIDSLGMGLIMVGLMVQAGFTLVTVKLILIVVFILFTSPTTTHALARAALNGGVNPLIERKPDDGADPSNI